MKHNEPTKVNILGNKNNAFVTFSSTPDAPTTTVSTCSTFDTLSNANTIKQLSNGGKRRRSKTTHKRSKTTHKPCKLSHRGKLSNRGKPYKHPNKVPYQFKDPTHRGTTITICVSTLDDASVLDYPLL